MPVRTRHAGLRRRASGRLHALDDRRAADTVTPPIEQAEAFVAATGASIHHGGGRAYYRPSTDSIHLPSRQAFIGTLTSTPAKSYFSTLCHELNHWTSHESRCNRQLGKRFGDQAYAIEELVTELGAAFLCADLSITDDPRADHAQYLASPRFQMEPGLVTLASGDHLDQKIGVLIHSR